MKKLKNEGAEIFVPDNKSEYEAISRTTHMGFGAHSDDLEIMAFDGIKECFRNIDKWFFGVTVVGGGGLRGGPYAKYSEDDMRKVRRKEQKEAAIIGEYAGVAYLGYRSEAVCDPTNQAPTEDIKDLLALAKPSVVYTHSLTDKHPTHLAVVLRTIMGLRELSLAPILYGCEVWRSLDWMVDGDKVPLDVSDHKNLEAALLGVYDSQIRGGKKRYDLAVPGRRRANATFYKPDEDDKATSVIFAMDLTPLVVDRSLDIEEYVEGYIKRFHEEVSAGIREFLNGSKPPAVLPPEPVLVAESFNGRLL